jgi:carboxyl-terminal processing protease
MLTCTNALFSLGSPWYDTYTMENKNRLGVIAVMVLVAFGAGLLLGARTMTHATQAAGGTEATPEGVDLDPVWKAWRLLEEKYVPATTTAPLTAQDRVWGMIDGLARSYGDPYTVFMPPEEAQTFGEEISGQFGGVGVEIGMRDNILTVIAPVKGTPGAAAGILAGDLILEVDGKSTANMTIDQAVRAIRGEVGTEVVLTIAREGEKELRTIPVVRAVIEIPTLDTELRPDGIFVISLYNFGGTATAEMRRALREFMQSGSQRLILDLRGNPGGYLEAAVDMASWFLPVGKAVVTEDFGGHAENIVHRSKGYNDIAPKRMAILIDRGSASASEILAGALSEYHTAVLIGERSYGKGSVQELIDLTPNTSLKVTVARWLTPNGISISESGLTPDLAVPMTQDDVDAHRDPQLDAAVEYVLSGKLVAPATTTPATATTTSSRTEQ